MTSAAPEADDEFWVAFQTAGTFLQPARHSELVGTVVVYWLHAVSAVVAGRFIDCISEVFSMSIARSFLLVLSVASTPASPLASLRMSADETERGVTWARDRFSALTPYVAPTRYLNYLKADAVDVLPQPSGRA